MSNAKISTELGDYILEIVKDTFMDYYRSNDLTALKDAKEINIWNLFNLNMKGFIKDNNLGKTIVKSKKHIFQIGNNQFTFNKFNKNKKRNCTDSQLTLEFKEGKFDKEYKPNNLHFEVGYIHIEDVVSIYANIESESQLLGQFNISLIKLDNVLRETIVEEDYNVLQMREKNKEVKNG